MTTEHLATFLGALRANGVTEYEGPVGEFVVRDPAYEKSWVADNLVIKVKLSPAPAPAVERPARKAPATPSVAPAIAELRAAAGLTADDVADLQATLSG